MYFVAIKETAIRGIRAVEILVTGCKMIQMEYKKSGISRFSAIANEGYQKIMRSVTKEKNKIALMELSLKS